MDSLRSDMRARQHLLAVTCSLLFIISFAPLHAQQLSNYRVKVFPVRNDTLVIDTLSIVPGSLIAETKTGIISLNDYSMDEWKGKLVWKKKPSADSVRITYRVLPISLGKNYSHKNFAELNRSDSLHNVPIIYSPEELAGNQLNFGALNYNGSFAKGITFGNNQDLVVNSSFNLQLQGRLAGDVDVLAAMSDNNIPIQPEGNTQQIQDFDKIFIQFKKNRSSLTVGDYELARPAGYFMNFYKKLQGASFTTLYNQGPDYSFKTAVSAAVAKGKYARNSFIGQEGNQGPYRLTGNNGEVYIIILAGTERVYIDGQLMTRGADRDYVIDYNAGEITFTPTRLITKDKRISVEFQYSEKAYLRTTFFANQEMESNRWNVRFNFYSEQDAKNQPLEQTLNDTEKAILSDVGDSLDRAYVQSVDSVPFTKDRPLYKKADSLGQKIYVYSTNADSAHFAVNFSYVGTNKGNYVISNNLANGRVYAWVAPIDGIPQGQYEPIVPLIAPQRNQLLTLGSDYKISKNSTLTAEGALSNTDLNTFSTEGNNDNVGFAAHVGFQQKIPLDTSRINPAQIAITAQYEFAAKNFKPIERYRPVEFDRDWNIQGASAAPANENLITTGATLSKTSIGAIQYNITLFSRETLYTGLNNALNGNYSHGGFRFTWLASYLASTSDSEETKFLRPSFDISQRFKFMKGIILGIHGEQEHDKILIPSADSLSRSSFYYNEGKIYLKNGDTTKIRFNIDATSRTDYSPTVNQFQRANIGNTLDFGAGLFSNPNSVLQFTTTLRDLKIADTTLTSQKPDQSVLGRITYDLNLKKGFITSNTLLEAGSGQEPKLEFAYTKVPDGTGTYTWIDYNDDGIQQINEFEVAAFQSDADYVKIFLPTNEYVKAYNTQFNESFGITPQRLWSRPEGFNAALSRLSALATFQVNKKTFRGNFETEFNPFFLNVDDSLLLSTSSVISGFLYYNRTSSKFGVDLSYQNNKSKDLLTNGVEIRTQQNYAARFRWNFSKKFSAIIKGSTGTNGYATEYLPQNDYAVKSYITEPQLNFQPSNVFRISLSYGYNDSRNTYGETGENAISHKAALDLKYNVITKSELDVTASFIQVNYHGALNTPVAYAILQGLQDGSNYLLDVSFEKKLSSFLEMTLTYEGRKNGNAKLINTGQAQIRALF